MLEFPYPLDLRWNYIHWLPVHFKRLQASWFWLQSPMDVRGVTISLWALAMEEDPPGTLPSDTSKLSFRLRISEDEWERLRSMELGPLHGWVPVNCGGNVRLTHPVMLEALEVAVSVAKLRQRGTTKRRRGDPPDAGRKPIS